MGDDGKDLIAAVGSGVVGGAMAGRLLGGTGAIAGAVIGGVLSGAEELEEDEGGE